MEVGDHKRKASSSYWFNCCTKWNPEQEEKNQGNIPSHDLKIAEEKKKKKPGGWRAMPYILGNETFERLATFGLLANFMVYLMKEYHMEQVAAANVLNLWYGITNFAPLVGAFISDAYVGRFRTIAFASCSSFLGMVVVTLTAWLPSLHPSKCQANAKCQSPTSFQLGVLLMGLGLLSVGTGGIRPCSIPFGVDQFDPTTEEGVKGINSFFNWYYTTFTVVILITSTVVVYIQDSVSWVLGFGIPTVCMFCSIILFFVGTRIYVHAKPEGSIFSSIVQVFVAAYKKRGIKLPDDDGDIDGVFYDPPQKEALLYKLPISNQCRFLNKAAVIEKNDLNPDGTCGNVWRLCSIQQVEEVKCLLKIGPVWASGIISFTSILQQGTFTVSQAMKMDRHLGPNFQIPPGSMVVISMITIGIWVPIYDRIVVPALRKITNHEGGITLLQRIGIGIGFSILSMIIAGLVERERRTEAMAHPRAPISAMWLAPQLVTMGFCEAFNIIGQIEFYNKEFPEHMRSIANSLFLCSFAGASYLNSLVIVIVHKTTRTKDHPDWLTNDINAGRLDYFYSVLAGLGVLNFLYFLYCAHRYRYKSPVQIQDKPCHDVELNLGKISPS